MCVYMLGPLMGACIVCVHARTTDGCLYCGNTVIVMIFLQIIASIASSISSKDNIKRAITLALFGREPKNPGRWLNLAFPCGDPLTHVKSSFLP